MIFVTGATGLLGNSIVRELCQRNIATRVLCRRGSPTAPLDGLPVEIVEGDLSQRELLYSAVEGCSAVIHSAAMIHIGWQRLHQSRDVNVEGTRRMVAACLHHRARLLHISTVDTLPAAVDNSHLIDERAVGGIAKVPCSYVVSKTEAERVVRNAIAEQGLEAVILHPGFMLGPYDWKPSSGRMFLEVVKSPIVAAPAGGCSLCDARHVATACVNAIAQGESGQNYILAGENLSYRELWTRMLDIAGRRKRVYRLGPAAKFFGKLVDSVFRYLPIQEGDVNGATIAMGNLNHYYDSRKAADCLDYDPSISQQSLIEIWQWLKDHHHSRT